MAPAAYHWKRSQLDNGLTVVTVAMPHLHSAQVALYARVGSRHEVPETNGLSHFLEHMYFRGCEGFVDSAALNAAMEDLGGTLDGYTMRDLSAYHTAVHPDHVEDATEILGSMFLSPAFQDIQIERQIILEELLDSLDDRGRVIDLDTIAHREAFKDHPLGLSIDGPRRNLKRFSVDDLFEHRRTWYGARNLVLCFAGNIRPRRCRAAARRAFGPLAPGRRVREVAPPMPSEPARFTFVRCDDAQTRARFSFRTVAETHADHPALSLLRRVLDSGLSGRLQVEMVERRGIAYDVSADLEPYSDCGLLNFEFAVAHRKLTVAIETLGMVLRDLRENEMSKDDLARVVRRARIGVEIGMDAPAELAQWFGETQLFHDPMRPEKRVQQMQALSPAEVRRVARKYLTPKRLTVAAVGGADVTAVRAAKRALKEFAEAL